MNEPTDSEFIRPSPTKGQVLALGYLMICHQISTEPGISLSDIQELQAMHLCHPRYRNFHFIGWYITSRLLREWAPYHRYAVEWHQCYRMLAFASPLSFTMVKDKLQFPPSVSDVKAFMDTLVLECGRGLASNWLRWKMEDQDRREDNI